MQFLKNGPDVPDRLLQDHEEGRVVFFCGAGISYPAGLRGFNWLVDEVYGHFNIVPNSVQEAARKSGRFDMAIGLLESEVPGGRLAVREAIRNFLLPKSLNRKATETHQALLTLSKNRGGEYRLITTNFDRLFEESASRDGLEFERFAAPMLPIPKQKRINGLVYLHGLLPATSDTNALQRLVISSGDFGLAYLTERWAARFVGEIFRNFTVCFVGYSINDPVLRYMMDALAADKLLGEASPEFFAFGEYKIGHREKAESEWKAKNVTPILYKLNKAHSLLHKTLSEWARTYRDGVQGKERIVSQYALAMPTSSTEQDDFVGRMLWAISDLSGSPAKHFAEFKPAPPLDWLEYFYFKRYRHADLIRFGVRPNNDVDDKLTFSVAERPCPYALAPWMRLLGSGTSGASWDNIQQNLARWLSRHLGDPRLILWLTKYGGHIHQELARTIQAELSRIQRLQQNANSASLQQILDASPNGVPDDRLYSIWRMVLDGQTAANGNQFGLYDWFGKLAHSGLTASLRVELRRLLAPRVMFRAAFHVPDNSNATQGRPEKEEIEWDLVLATRHVHSTISDHGNDAAWLKVIGNIYPDIFPLLRDALDLMRDLGGADDKFDRSYIDHPSIPNHPQNHNFHDWTVLIVLLRDSWCAIAKQDIVRARRYAEDWFEMPYPLFKRLAFFAARSENVIEKEQAVAWILSDNGWWLWSTATQREVIRLLAWIGVRLERSELKNLENAILAGPPREMFKDDLSVEDWNRIIDRIIWLRLAKLVDAGTQLGTEALAKYREISERRSEWRIAEDERDEFPFWLGDGDDGRSYTATPIHRRELVEWLKLNQTEDHWDEDNWQERCRREFGTTFCALYSLSCESLWIVDRWRQAINAWSEESLAYRRWRWVGPVLWNAPDDILISLSPGLSRWLNLVAKKGEGASVPLLAFLARMLHLDYEEKGVHKDYVTHALNHPLGRTVDAVIKMWYRQGLQDDQSLTSPYREWFTEICDTSNIAFRNGRVHLAVHTMTLFRVDEDWCKSRFLPLFDWNVNELEATAVWQGFLWSPRIHHPLLEAFKQSFLACSHHYTELGDFGSQYARFLTYVALDSADVFSEGDLRLAFRALPPHAIAIVADTLAESLKSAGPQKEQHWSNRVSPFLKSVWPQGNEYATKDIVESLAELCIVSGKSFPEAFDQLRHWLKPIKNLHVICVLLVKSELCSRHPAEALQFLAKIVDLEADWPPQELEQCLNEIVSASPELLDAPSVRQIREYLHRMRGRLA